MKRRDFITGLAGAAVGLASARATSQIQPAAGLFDIASGLCAYRRIGSIAAGSNVLHFVDPTTFQAGDQIVVEVGGEEGEGKFGTTGVGGIVPSAADDRSQFYYRSQDLPLALIAKVTAISDGGRIARLDKTAVTTAVNANVHFDNLPVLEKLLAEKHPPGWTIVLPAGEFAISDTIAHKHRSGWTITGAGKGITVLRSPKGTPGGGLHCFEADHTEIRDLSIIGNTGQNGFGLRDHGNGWVEYGVGVLLTKSANCLVANVSCVDVFRKAVWGEYTDGLQVIDCHLSLTQPFRGYLEWWFGASDSRNGVFNRCAIDSSYLIPGFETFRSDRMKFIDCGGKNASFSSNSSGNFLLEGFDLRVTKNAQFDETSFHHLNPAVNINSNIQPPNETMLEGGVIRNTRITVEGPIDARGNLLTGIVINESNPNVTIEGGLIGYPDGIRGAGVGPFGVNSTGKNTIIRDLVVTGKPANRWEANIYVRSGRVVNCLAERIRLDSEQL
jgi:hypothetical protein